MYALQETNPLVFPSKILDTMLTHTYENHRSFPLKQKTKESL